MLSCFAQSRFKDFDGNDYIKFTTCDLGNKEKAAVPRWLVVKYFLWKRVLSDFSQITNPGGHQEVGMRWTTDDRQRVDIGLREVSNEKKI